MMQELIVGIIGGMGPEATVDLMEQIIRLTPAQEDNDHIRCIVDSNAKIPSRIKALYEGTGESPVPALIDTAKRLEGYGVDFLVMPCHTAHYYYNQIQHELKIPLLNLLDITTKAAQTRISGLKRVGLLATTATVETGLYTQRIKNAGLELVLPDEKSQQKTLDLIHAIKAGQTGPLAGARLDELVDHLSLNGAEAIILGCTELGLACRQNKSTTIIDGIVELARATVLKVKGVTVEDQAAGSTLPTQ